MNHPKSRQIRLPFDVPRPNKASETVTRVCGICRKNDSKYTCPRCNIVYCSLACFRDESHAQCSEPFYKSTVMEQISSDPKAALEEKKNMIEMLRRFEESEVDGEDALKELDDEDEDDDLAERLKDVVLDGLDSNALFHLLPQAHRDKFLEAIRNPESEITKELLNSAVDDEDNAAPSVLPWWEGEVLEDTPEKAGEAYADIPELVDGVLFDGIAPLGIGFKLAYNAIAICLAYVHTLLSLRLPSLDSLNLDRQQVSSEEVRTEIGHVVPFLVEARSTVRYSSVREAWTGVWDNIAEESTELPDQALLIRLLSIVPGLIHPPILLSSSPKITPLLSDLHSLFSRPKPSIPVRKKLLFYLSAMSQLSRDDWLALEKEVDKEIANLEKEVGSSQSEAEDVPRPALRIIDT